MLKLKFNNDCKQWFGTFRCGSWAILTSTSMRAAPSGQITISLNLPQFVTICNSLSQFATICDVLIVFPLLWYIDCFSIVVIYYLFFHCCDILLFQAKVRDFQHSRGTPVCYVVSQHKGMKSVLWQEGIRQIHLAIWTNTMCNIWIGGGEGWVPLVGKL